MHSNSLLTLRDYCTNNSDALPDGTELFLLRNLTRGKGVGFFDSGGFYPDFILWVKGKDGQRIVFIDPHGMRQEKAYIHDDRVRLHERLPELSKEIARRSGNPSVQLDSFIVSGTKYDDCGNTIVMGPGLGMTSQPSTFCFKNPDRLRIT